MNNENKYKFINNLPKEYHRIFWDIMISAESDKELCVRFHKSECKLIMRYLYRKDKEIERLNNIINELEKELKEGSFDVYFCSTSSQKTFKANEIIIKSMILNKLKELKEEK